MFEGVIMSADLSFNVTCPAKIHHSIFVIDRKVEMRLDDSVEPVELVEAVEAVPPFPPIPPVPRNRPGP